jgi:type IV secretory pathway VirB2 component (pilin)
MFEREQTLRTTASVQEHIAKSLLSIIAVASIASPAAASHDSLECSPPESLSPLIDLLHSLGELAFLAGVTIGTIGFLFAGICLMLPGQDWTRRGKDVSKNVFIGVILLLSANMIVSFLISEMGGTIC